MGDYDVTVKDEDGNVLYQKGCGGSVVVVENSDTTIVTSDGQVIQHEK